MPVEIRKLANKSPHFHILYIGDNTPAGPFCVLRENGVAEESPLSVLPRLFSQGCDLQEHLGGYGTRLKNRALRKSRPLVLFLHRRLFYKRSTAGLASLQMVFIEITANDHGTKQVGHLFNHCISISTVPLVWDCEGFIQ